MASLSTPTALDCPPPASTLDLPYEVTSPSEARRWAAGVLAGVVSEETVYAVRLCLSELVTNSQVHTRPAPPGRQAITCRLAVVTDDGVRVRVEVVDAGSPGKTPEPRHVNACDVSGRGLAQVVAGYADSWGFETRGPHECVTWFEVEDSACAAVVAAAEGIAGG